MKRTRTYASLKQWRDDLGLSQRDAALVLGISQGSYQKFEVGRHSPRRLKAKAISKKTGVPIVKLLRVA